MKELFNKLSIRNKLVMIVHIIGFITLGMTFGITTFFMMKATRKSMVDNLSVQLKMAGEFSIGSLSSNNKKNTLNIINRLADTEGFVHCGLFDKQGNCMIAVGDTIINALHFYENNDSKEASFEGDYLILSQDIYSYKVLLGTIKMIVSTENIRKEIRLRVITTNLSFLALMLIGYLLTLYFHRFITRPVIALTEAAKEITETNDYSLRVIKTTKDEIGELYDYFNAMLEKTQYYLVELEKNNKELEEFNYVASHDLREPLRTITSYCDLLEQDIKTKLSADAQQDMQFIKDAAKRMNTLIQDLLELSRTGRTDFNAIPVDLNQVIENVKRDLSYRLNESGGAVINSSLPIVMGDAMQISRVFQNIISNALKFHREIPPLIEISAYNEPTTEIDFNKDKECAIAFKDNGIGIEQRYLEKIFLPFKRLHGVGKFEGTGIGLAIVKKIIDRHGGSIKVYSKPDHGSIFYITFKKVTA